MISALAAVGGIVMVLVILHWIIEALQRAAAAEARLEDAKKASKVAAKQAEEMLKERTVEETARDLDAGEF
jgi:CO dehydrogenase/acetyl-CoA synthase alpha subunit